MLALVAFAAADGLGNLLTPHYSTWSDATSELVEKGATHKHLLDPLLLLFHGLVIPFAIGIGLAIHSAETRPADAILVAIWLVGDAMRFAPDWRGFATYSKATAKTGAGLAEVSVALAETDHVGVAERLLTWSYLQWYVVIGIALATGRAEQGGTLS